MIRRSLCLAFALFSICQPQILLAKAKGEFGIRGIVSPFEADPLAWELDRMARKLVEDNPGSFSNAKFSNPDAGRIAGGVGFNLDLVWKKKSAWKSALRAGLDLRLLRPRVIRATIQDDYYSYMFSERAIRLETKVNQVLGTLAYSRRFGDSQISLILGGGYISLQSELFDQDFWFYTFWTGQHSVNLSTGTIFTGGVELNHRLGGPLLVSVALEFQALDIPSLTYGDFQPPIHLKDMGAAGRLGLTIAPGWEGVVAKKKKVRKPIPEPEPEPEEEEEEPEEEEMEEE